MEFFVVVERVVVFDVTVVAGDGFVVLFLVVGLLVVAVVSAVVVTLVSFDEVSSVGRVVEEVVSLRTSVSLHPTTHNNITNTNSNVPNLFIEYSPFVFEPPFCETRQEWFVLFL